MDVSFVLDAEHLQDYNKGNNKGTVDNRPASQIGGHTNGQEMQKYISCSCIIDTDADSSFHHQRDSRGIR